MSLQKTTRACLALFKIQNYSQQTLIKIKNHFEDPSSDCNFLIYGAKSSPSNNSANLKGYIQWTKEKRLKQLQRDWKCSFFKSFNSSKQNLAYASKNRHTVIYGQERKIDKLIKEGSKRGGQTNKQRWDEARKLANQQKLNEIEADIAIKCRFQLKDIAREALSTDRELYEPQNLWIYGKSGVGKSFLAQDFAEYLGEPFYIKNKDNYWEGYKGQAVVIVEDFGKNEDFSLQLLIKTWTGTSGFMCELNGGSSKIRPYHIVVVSSFSLEDCFTEDSNLCEVVSKAFFQFEMKIPVGFEFWTFEMTADFLNYIAKKFHYPRNDDWILYKRWKKNQEELEKYLIDELDDETHNKPINYKSYFNDEDFEPKRNYIEGFKDFIKARLGLSNEGKASNAQLSVLQHDLFFKPKERRLIKERKILFEWKKNQFLYAQLDYKKINGDDLDLGQNCTEQLEKYERFRNGGSLIGKIDFGLGFNQDGDGLDRAEKIESDEIEDFNFNEENCCGDGGFQVGLLDFIQRKRLIEEENCLLEGMLMKKSKVADLDVEKVEYDEESYL